MLVSSWWHKIEPVVYVAHLIAFYIYIVGPIGDGVAKKCTQSWACARYYKSTEVKFRFQL